MTLSKMQKLKTQMVNEFGSIFDLCKSVLSANVPESLSKAAFETLLKFISWIPIQFVFQQSLIDILTRKVMLLSLLEMTCTHVFFLVYRINHSAESHPTML
jgi:exportin-1